MVFVHGVPETDAVWRPLRGAPGQDDVVRLSPPGIVRLFSVWGRQVVFTGMWFCGDLGQAAAGTPTASFQG